MAEKFWKTWNAVTSALVVVAVVLAALLVGPRLFGFHVFSVLSGSMEPELPTGSVIYVKSVDTADLQTGDVITYMMSENVVATHRITGIVPCEDGVTRYRTKGDANEVEDAVMVHPANVIGSPVLTIPYLGRLASGIQTKAGIYKAVSAAAFLAVLVVLPELFGKEETKQEEKSRSPGFSKNKGVPPYQSVCPIQTDNRLNEGGCAVESETQDPDRGAVCSDDDHGGDDTGAHE